MLFTVNMVFSAGVMGAFLSDLPICTVKITKGIYSYTPEISTDDILSLTNIELPVKAQLIYFKICLCKYI